MRKAKEIISWAIVALGGLIVAYAIVMFVISRVLHAQYAGVPFEELPDIVKYLM